MCLWVHECIIHATCSCGCVVGDMLVSGGVYVCHTVPLPAVKADSSPWLYHFTQWRALEETPKLQLRP